MKKNILLVFAMLVPLLVNCKVDNSPNCQIRWCTFNIRLLHEGDEKAGVGWSVRKDRVANYIKEKHIDIVGMQEVLHPQLQDLLERLPEYDYVGVGRTDGKTKGEYSPVFFLKEKYEVLEKGNFWLSETPDVPGSKGWDAALERIASYAKLRDKATGKVFMAVNTHFDHVGTVAREEAGKLIMERMEALVPEGDVVFLTGDFNANWDNPILGPIREKLGNCRETAPETDGRNTFNAWGEKDVPDGTDIIDHIFYRGVTAVRYEVLTGDYGVPFVSDHWPVLGTFRY